MEIIMDMVAMEMIKDTVAIVNYNRKDTVAMAIDIVAMVNNWLSWRWLSWIQLPWKSLLP